MCFIAGEEFPEANQVLIDRCRKDSKLDLSKKYTKKA